MSSPFISRTVTIQGTRISVAESHGRGPAVMMIHGNSSSSLAFRRQLEGSLGEKFRIVALDLPGHGSSDQPGDPATTYSLPGFASVVAAVAVELDIGDQFFAGWSLGGHILLEALPLLPHARGFCIFGTPPARMPLNFEEIFLPHPAGRLLFQESVSDAEMKEWVASYLPIGEPMPEQLVAEIRRSDPRMRPLVGASVAGMHYRDETEIVAGMTQPLAVLHGAGDALVNLSYIESLPMPSLWRGAVQLINGAGHAPQWSAPDAFNALVEAFVESAG